MADAACGAGANFGVGSVAGRLVAFKGRIAGALAGFHTAGTALGRVQVEAIAALGADKDFYRHRGVVALGAVAGAGLVAVGPGEAGGAAGGATAESNYGDPRKKKVNLR